MEVRETRVLVYAILVIFIIVVLRGMFDAMVMVKEHPGIKEIRNELAPVDKAVWIGETMFVSGALVYLFYKAQRKAVSGGK